MAKKERKNPHKAPMERFIWREGDVKIVNDPHEKRKERENANLDDMRQTK